VARLVHPALAGALALVACASAAHAGERIASGVSLWLVPGRGQMPKDLVAAGEVHLRVAVGGGAALEIGTPFAAWPLAAGSPSAGVTWTFYEQPGSGTSLAATLRLHVPAAPESGEGGAAAFGLGALLPFAGASWDPRLTVAPGLTFRLEATRYALGAEMSLQVGATGPVSPSAAIAYLLSFAGRPGGGVELLAEVAGRAFAHGGYLEQRSLVGVAAGVRWRGSLLVPHAMVRVPLGDGRRWAAAFAEIGLEARY
jgi:hypothetical protein